MKQPSLACERRRVTLLRLKNMERLRVNPASVNVRASEYASMSRNRSSAKVSLRPRGSVYEWHNVGKTKTRN